MPYIAATILILLVIGVITRIHRSRAARRTEKQAVKRGEKGEKTTAKLLSTLPSSHYLTLNDVFIQHNGRHAQIDHVVVSVYGIFVLETKNYSGVIYGHDGDEYWQQSIGNGYKGKMINPVRQNLYHQSILKPLLPRTTYHSVIVFGDRANPQCSSTALVTTHENLIRDITARDREVLSNRKMWALYRILQKVNIKDKTERQKYINAIKTKHKRTGHH